MKINHILPYRSEIDTRLISRAKGSHLPTLKWRNHYVEYMTAET